MIDRMKKDFKVLLVFLGLACMFSCQSKFGVLEYSPLQEYEYSSDEQVFSFALEDFANMLVVNYWEGTVEMQSTQPELVGHANRGPNIHDDFYVEGEWFTAKATHEPLKLEVRIEKNGSNSPRHIEMYVDIVSRDAAGKATQKSGAGYHIVLHQAAHL